MEDETCHWINGPDVKGIVVGSTILGVSRT